jgi:hypothetical protein
MVSVIVLVLASGVQVSPSPSQIVTPTVIVTVSASQPSAALVTGSVGTTVLISLLRLDVPIEKAEVTNSDNQATDFLIVESL